MAVKFEKGLQIAWAKRSAPMFGAGTVLKKAALQSAEPDVQFGEVVDHDDVGNPIVELSSGEVWTLTNEELVRVED